MENQPEEKSTAATTKQCPHCKAEIPISAKKCSHCGSDFRVWFARHPFLTVIFGLVILIFLVGLGGGGSSSNVVHQVITPVHRRNKPRILKRVLRQTCLLSRVFVIIGTL
jgi:ribosomal protein L40E